jgi:hypothetical protein
VKWLLLQQKAKSKHDILSFLFTVMVFVKFLSLWQGLFQHHRTSFIFINSVISANNLTSSLIITHNDLQGYYSRIKQSWHLKSKYTFLTRSKTCKDASRPIDDERHLSRWELTSSCGSAKTLSNCVYIEENKKYHDNEYAHCNSNVGYVRAVEWKSEILTQVT